MQELSWEALTLSQQEKYIQQASYLIERGYVYERDILLLAERIYNKTSKEHITAK